MLKQNNQMTLNFSKYSELYDILIPQNNKWRRMNEEVDFSFIYEYLKDNYSKNMGRTAKDVIFMFKLLLLKTESGLSDEGLIKMVNVNMEYKYFLGLEPEEKDIIDPSLLTKFRRNRIAKYEKDENGKLIKVVDKSQELMDTLISKTVDLAITKGIIKKRNIGIVDSTHTLSMYGHITPREKLIKVSKELRKKIYKLLELLDNDGRFVEIPSIEENMNLLREIIEDTNVELEYSKDQEAKIGHKTADTEFFGYKTHIMMSEERIITAATVTTGEKHDGKELQELTKKTIDNGIELEAIVGDGAYSEKENLEFCNESGIKNVSKLSENVRICMFVLQEIWLLEKPNKEVKKMALK